MPENVPVHWKIRIPEKRRQMLLHGISSALPHRKAAASPHLILYPDLAPRIMGELKTFRLSLLMDCASFGYLNLTNKEDYLST